MATSNEKGADMPIGPEHQPGVFNIEVFDGSWWRGEMKRFKLNDAIDSAKLLALETGRRHRVSSSEGEIVFDTSTVLKVGALTVIAAKIAVLKATQPAAHDRVAGLEIPASELREALAIMVELVSAAHRADGDQRPSRPERGAGYSDAEWEIFLRGWDAHAEAIFHSGLRTALSRM